MGGLVRKCIKCPTCGKTLNGKEYKLTHAVMRTFFNIRDLGPGVHKLRDILSKTDMVNITVLRTAGLINYRDHYDWYITDYGYNFLSGKMGVPLRIYTDEEGNVLWESTQVYISYYNNINFGRRKKEQ